MRNASKNTIKRVMRKAVFDQRFKTAYFHPEFKGQDNYAAYFLFNEIGAQIFRMTQGKICNRGLIGMEKYCKTV